MPRSRFMVSKPSKKAYRKIKSNQEVWPEADFKQANQAKRHTGKQKQVKKYAPKSILSKPIKQKGIPEHKIKLKSMPRAVFLRVKTGKRAYQNTKSSQKVCYGDNKRHANKSKQTPRTKQKSRKIKLNQAKKKNTHNFQTIWHFCLHMWENNARIILVSAIEKAFGICIIQSLQQSSTKDEEINE